jgi:tartrate dehydratase beta subunit/fumarate hydratase class I family protein
MEEKRIISAPFTDETIRSLHAGDMVYISGTIYTARDAAHKRLCEMLDAGEPIKTMCLPCIRARSISHITFKDTILVGVESLQGFHSSETLE